MENKGKCKTCRHYGFWQIIQQPYGYSGYIPCLNCKEWLKPQDNYEPNEEQSQSQ